MRVRAASLADFSAARRASAIFSFASSCASWAFVAAARCSSSNVCWSFSQPSVKQIAATTRPAVRSRNRTVRPEARGTSLTCHVALWSCAAMQSKLATFVPSAVGRGAHEAGGDFDGASGKRARRGDLVRRRAAPIRSAWRSGVLTDPALALHRRTVFTELGDGSWMLAAKRVGRQKRRPTRDDAAQCLLGGLREDAVTLLEHHEKMLGHARVAPMREVPEPRIVARERIHIGVATSHDEIELVRRVDARLRLWHRIDERAVIVAVVAQ